MGASRKCPDMVGGRMGASRDRAAGEPAGHAATLGAGMRRRQPSCPGSRVLKSSGSAAAASSASSSPPLPGVVGAARARGTVTRGRAHRPGCLTRSARPVARVPAGGVLMAPAPVAANLGH